MRVQVANERRLGLHKIQKGLSLSQLISACEGVGRGGGSGMRAGAGQRLADNRLIQVRRVWLCIVFPIL